MSDHNHAFPCPWVIRFNPDRANKDFTAIGPNGRIGDFDSFDIAMKAVLGLMSEGADWAGIAHAIQQDPLDGCKLWWEVRQGPTGHRSGVDGPCQECVRMRGLLEALVATPAIRVELSGARMVLTATGSQADELEIAGRIAAHAHRMAEMRLPYWKVLAMLAMTKPDDNGEWRALDLAVEIGGTLAAMAGSDPDGADEGIQLAFSDFEQVANE